MNTFTDDKLNHWLRYDGEGFLSGLRDTSHARKFCRSYIISQLESGKAKSVIEFGIGGLNERIALADYFTKHAHQGITYTGTDWAPQFAERGRKLFPRSEWITYDVVKGEPLEQRDIGYSQHVLEHCSGLCPALANMLQSTRKVLLNIFFLPLKQDADIVNFSKYPMYHNTYSYDHVQAVCEHHGFSAQFKEFDNIDLSHDPRFETVLIATRK